MPWTSPVISDFWPLLVGDPPLVYFHMYRGLCIGNPQVRLFDACSPRLDPLNIYDGHTGNVTSVGFQRDSRWMFTSSEDGSIRIWDTRTTKSQRNYADPKRVNVNDVQLHPDQAELLSVDQNGSIKLWDLTANACVKEWSTGRLPLTSLSLSSDGTLLCASNYAGQIFVYSLTSITDSGQEVHPMVTFEAHPTFITKCCLSPDGTKLATASADHTIRLWSTGEFHLENTLLGHSKWVWDIAFSADSAYLLSGSSDHSARLWDLESGDSLRHYMGHDKAVVAIALNDLPL